METHERITILESLTEISNRCNFNEIYENMALSKELVHKVQEKNVLITGVESIPFEHPKNKLYYSVARPNFDCGFIFDHPLDHYSFVLLIEMARQMCIAVTHKYNNRSTEGIKNTVDGVDLKIHRFAELDYPVIIGCYDQIRKDKPSMLIRDLEIFFVQKGNLCAEIKSSISVMIDSLYVRYRSSNRKQIDGATFPIKTNIDMSNLTYVAG